MKNKTVSKQPKVGHEPRATVPIRRDAHKAARIACAHTGQRLVDFVSAAVAVEAKRVNA